MGRDRMLTGVTLLDFSSMGPGPRATRLLADYGMRVIKVRPPRGNRMMSAPWYAYSANRGIPQVHVDLKDDEGRRLVHRMIAEADVMVESFRPGVAARLGIGYDAVRAVREDIVYCSVSGYGQSGPYARWPAHDLNWLGLCGYLATGSARADGGPALPGSTIADTLGGFSTATAILAAVVERLSTGRGRFLDVSVIDAVLRTMQFVLDGHLAAGETEERDDQLTGRYACYDAYQAGDGRWLTVAALEPHFWAALCEGTGLGDRSEEQLDPDRQDELRNLLSSAFRTRARDEWVRLLGPTACVAPVNEPSEVLADPHLKSRPLTLTARVDGKPVRQMAPRLPIPDPCGLGDRPAGTTPPDAVNALLREFGVADDEISALRAKEVIT